MVTDIPPVSPLIVVRPFAPGPHPWSRGHRGVDLRSIPGQPVRAPRKGTVTFTGKVAGRSVVVITHGSRRTTLEPVVARVAVGQKVRAGDTIGQASTGGHCAASCIHWGLRRGKVYLDPMAHWSRPVLKPLDG